ncbi:AAA family ATPase [Devosia albogilva]|uniref:AAA family ATPase n=1 Tax=Devosia albogilva TaxID=429726 RepID=A0ABW5QMQ0_9HYPH
MSSFDFHPDDATEHESLTAPDAQRALIRAALVGTNTRQVRQALARTSPQVIVITTPSAAWSTALVSEIAQVYERSWAAAVTEQKKDHNKWVGDSMLSRIEAGHHVVLCVHDTSLLPPSVLSAADVRLELPPVDASLVRRAIKSVTGGRVQKLVDSDFAGLDFPALLLALRSGSTARECRDRLRRASSLATQRAESNSKHPTIEELPLSGEVHDWAHDLVAQLEAVAAGEMPAGELRHAVLCGPPGTGKTLIAGAVARSAGWTFHPATIGEWFTTSDGHLGGVSKACTSFFDGLLSQDCAVGFLDELDALPNRAALKQEDLQWWSTVINLMLTQVDRLRASGKKVLLLAATNYYDRLDTALVRPGRIEQRVELTPPRTETEIQAIFEHYVGSEIGNADLATITPFAMGSTPAAIAGWVRAARAVARREGRALEFRDLVGAVVPPDTRTLEEINAVAVHEAGHTLVARLLDIDVDSVSIVSQGVKGGVTRAAAPSSFPNRQEVEDYVTMLLAGRAADTVLGNKGAHAGAALDLSVAVQLLTRAHSEWGLFGTLAPASTNAGELLGQVETHLQRLLGRSHRLVKANRVAIQSLAKALADQRLLTGEQLDAVIAPHLVRGSGATTDVAAKVDLPADTDLVGDGGGDAKLA